MGIIAFLISLSFIITGVNIFINKDLFLLIENTFFIILYTLLGSIFFSFFYSNTFTLYINGNGGFVGTYLKSTFLGDLIETHELIIYYILILCILFCFLISINFHPVKFLLILKKIINIFKTKKENYTDKSEIINEYIPQDQIKNLIQKDLPFIKAENKNDTNIKFKLPHIDLLETPTKERNNLDKNETHDPEFLEKFC